MNYSSLLTTESYLIEKKKKRRNYNKFCTCGLCNRIFLHEKKTDLLEIDVDSSELSFLLTKSSKINRNNQ